MKTSGLGDNLYVAGYDLSGDIGSLQRIGGGPNLLTVTGIDKSAIERIGGLRDGAIEFSSYFNPATDQAHDRFSNLPTADAILTYCRGATIGNSAACMTAKQANYDGTRAADGSLTFAVSAMANGYGLEWGVQLTAGKRTDTVSPTSGTAVDLGTGSTSFGAQMYLQAFALTGTSCTVLIQHSTDSGSVDPWTTVTGGSFTPFTGPSSERLTTASNATIKRYVRATSSGTFTSATFCAVICRNLTATVF